MTEDQQPPGSLWQWGERDPDRPCIVTPAGDEYTAGQMASRSRQVVHALRGLGMEPGDVLACMVPNGREYVEMLLAIQQAGWYIVPLNYHLTGPEIAYIVNDSQAGVFVADERFADQVTASVADGLNVPEDHRFAIGSIEGFHDYQDLTSDQPTDKPADRQAGAIMTYTSGTTGRPKGVKRPLTGADPDLGAQMGQFLNHLFTMADPDNVHLVVAPLYHTAVSNFAQAALHGGHRVVLMDRWTPEETLRLIDTYKVTTSHMVPTMFNRLLKLPDEVRADYDMSSTRRMIHSAAPCPIPTKQAMLDWWGDSIWEYYAATEGGGTIASPEDWKARPGTVGKPWPISEVIVSDDDGNQLGPGEVGTIWMRMGEYRFTYHGDEEKTRKSWNDQGFFTVGDVGELDEDGFLFLRDRKIDMIIMGGVNLYPAEIESVLLQHDHVLDCAVFGIPDEDMGEQVKAAVQLVEDSEPSDELANEIIEWLRDQLGSMRTPKSIDFHDELPRDPNGKLYKRKLRDPYWEGSDSALV